MNKDMVKESLIPYIGEIMDGVTINNINITLKNIDNRLSAELNFNNRSIIVMLEDDIFMEHFDVI